MIAICKDKKEINFSVDEVYLIFGGEYYTNEETGQRYIRELLTQDDDGGLVFVSANSFFIPDVNFEKYILKADKFFWKCIGYDGFLFYYHDDNSERIRDYKKAKADFFTAKMELYDELTAETINRKLQNTSCLEQDFIFDYLRLRKIDDYIEWSIDNIRNAMINNRKWYDVYKCFEYLSSFESETVKQFFSEYLIKDHWKNDKINNIVYNYSERLPAPCKNNQTL